ncbi:hypothetical protein [Streptomyces sp. NRRL S-455]|uniref:hypothetical protein n=1 Tax=Streptomyces sp. NRRL S-455 TaxID=1463908 RepID=UPI0004BEAF9A|nr:hypothetical protein [Streptomyces sp. NRRL S-455]
MPRSEITDPAVRVLFAKHDPADSDQYGKCTAAGYFAEESADDEVRVSHRMPEPDLLDDDRMSSDEMAAERHRMVDAYATTLEAAGWTVERKGLHAQKPYLLARRPLTDQAAEALDDGLDKLFRRLGPPDA